MARFKAVVVEKSDSGQSVAFKDFDDADLMDGDVTGCDDASTVPAKSIPGIIGKRRTIGAFPVSARPSL